MRMSWCCYCCSSLICSKPAVPASRSRKVSSYLVSLCFAVGFNLYICALDEHIPINNLAGERGEEERIAHVATHTYTHALHWIESNSSCIYSFNITTFFASNIKQLGLCNPYAPYIIDVHMCTSVTCLRLTTRFQLVKGKFHYSSTSRQIYTSCRFIIHFNSEFVMWMKNWVKCVHVNMHWVYTRMSEQNWNSFGLNNIQVISCKQCNDFEYL